jgi:NADPH2:quinone reductase
VKANRLLLTNTAVIGAATNEFWTKHPDHPRQQWDDLVPMLESGALDPPISTVFSLDEAGDAIRTLDERRATGKVLVRVR